MGRKDKPIREERDPMLILGARMRRARQKKGISITELSRLIGYSKSHLSSVENGGGRPSYDLVAAYERELGLRRGELSHSANPGLILKHRPAAVPDARAPVALAGEEEAAVSRVPRIFVSHSHDDQIWCRQFVGTLRMTGADVFYDEHNLGYGSHMTEIEREIQLRPIFVVILSPSATFSRWIRMEAAGAISLQMEDAARIFVPIVASRCDIPLLWRSYKIISGTGGTGIAPAAAAARLAETLAFGTPTIWQSRDALTPDEDIAEDAIGIGHSSLTVKSRWLDSRIDAKPQGRENTDPDFTLAHSPRTHAVPIKAIQSYLSKQIPGLISIITHWILVANLANGTWMAHWLANEIISDVIVDAVRDTDTSDRKGELTNWLLHLASREIARMVSEKQQISMLNVPDFGEMEDDSDNDSEEFDCWVGVINLRTSDNVIASVVARTEFENLLPSIPHPYHRALRLAVGMGVDLTTLSEMLSLPVAEACTTLYTALRCLRHLWNTDRRTE